MLTCPMCKKKLRGVEKVCGNCRTDVSLLVDYVQHLQEGLDQAQAYTQRGELGEAVWAYLDVLEIDPDNGTARKQVGKVVTAVRQFDQTAPGRRWLKRLQKQTRFRRWLANANDEEGSDLVRWVNGLLWFILFLGVLILGFVMGQNSVKPPASGTEPAAKEAKENLDKDKDEAGKEKEKPAKEKGANDK